MADRARQTAPARPQDTRTTVATPTGDVELVTRGRIRAREAVLVDRRAAPAPVPARRGRPAVPAEPLPASPSTPNLDSET